VDANDVDLCEGRAFFGVGLKFSGKVARLLGDCSGAEYGEWGWEIHHAAKKMRVGNDVRLGRREEKWYASELDV